MNNTVAVNTYAELMENPPISPIGYDRVAAAAAAHDALAGGVPLLLVAGGSPDARAALSRALVVDRLAAGEDTLVLRDGRDPLAGTLAYLGLPRTAAEVELLGAVATYMTAQTRLVVLLEQAELLTHEGLAGVRRLRQADPAAYAMSLVLVGDDTVGLIADRLLRPSPPGGLRFIRLTPLALAPAGPVATFSLPDTAADDAPAAEPTPEAAAPETPPDPEAAPAPVPAAAVDLPSAILEEVAVGLPAEPESVPYAHPAVATDETAPTQTHSDLPAVAPPAAAIDTEAPPAPMQGSEPDVADHAAEHLTHEELNPSAGHASLASAPAAWQEETATEPYDLATLDADPPAAPHVANRSDDHDRDASRGEAFDRPATADQADDPAVSAQQTDYHDAFAQLAAQEAAESPRTAANPLRRSEIIPPLPAELQDASKPEPQHRPRIILPLTGIAIVAALVGWVVVRALLGVPGSIPAPPRVALAIVPPQTATSAPAALFVLTSPPASGGPAAPPEAASGPAANAPPREAMQPEGAAAPQVRQPPPPTTLSEAAPPQAVDTPSMPAVPVPAPVLTPPSVMPSHGSAAGADAAPVSPPSALPQSTVPQAMPRSAPPPATPASPPETTQQAMVQPPAPLPPPVVSAPSVPPPSLSPAMPAASSSATAMPAGPGLLVIAKADDTLHSLYSRVYRGLTAPSFDTVAAMNPHDIKLGDVVVFPAPPGGWKRLPNTAGR